MFDIDGCDELREKFAAVEKERDAALQKVARLEDENMRLRGIKWEDRPAFATLEQRAARLEEAVKLYMERVNETIVESQRCFGCGESGKCSKDCPVSNLVRLLK